MFQTPNFSCTLFKVLPGFAHEMLVSEPGLTRVIMIATSSYHLCSGSPPSLLLKGPNTDVNSSVVSFSVPQPTPQKNATAGHKGRRKASRDQFTVYIDKTGI